MDSDTSVRTVAVEIVATVLLRLPDDPPRDLVPLVQAEVNGLTMVPITVKSAVVPSLP